MHTLYPDQLSVKENYKLIIGSVVPRPIAFVTTCSTVNGAINAAPFSYFNAVSSDPPLLSLSIGRVEEQMKDTARNAVQNGELVIHICNQAIATEMNQTATALAADQSELELTNLSTVPSKVVSVPGIKEAPIRLECLLKKHIPLQNEQGKTVNDLLLAQIVCYHFSEEIFDADNRYIQIEPLQPIGRLAGDDYTTLGKTFTLMRET